MKYIFSLILILELFTLSGQSLNIPLITTKGTAQVYVPVDEVHFNITISKIENDISSAREENLKVSRHIIETLKNKGVNPKYIQSNSLEIGRNYLRNNRDKWEGFKATQIIYVCLLDPSMYDDIMEDLIVMDIVKIRGPEYKSSRSAKAMEEARNEAILIAKKKAIQLAEALGQSVGSAKLITENHAGRASVDTYSSGTTLVTDVESKNQSFEPGQLVIQASVSVSFLLEE